LDELLEWNKTFNLTGLGDRDLLIRHLVLDSLICAANLPTTGRLLDVGSGAGFPSVLVKIYSAGLEVNLLEPNRRKVSFLKNIKRVLCLRGFYVLRQRLEEHYPLNQSAYDALTVRGVKPAVELVGLVSPFLKDRGVVALFLGREADHMDVLRDSATKAGLRLRQKIWYSLPGLQARRCLVLFQRMGKDALTSSAPA